METPSLRRTDARLSFWIAGAVLFAVLATANAAGYRYSASDQAFYVPAVLRALDPAAFPRDAALLQAQARLMVLDEGLAALRRLTGFSLEAIFFGGYLLSVGLLWAALVLIGRQVYSTWWATAALAAAFTLRHRIPRTSANSFEPYFHPRMLAFALGLLAVSAVLRRRSWLAIALVACAALIHVTTALWFAVLAGVAIALVDRQLRWIVVAGAAVSVVALLEAIASGRMRAALAPMDDVWLAAVAGKDSLFPNQWPAWAWIANLALPAALWWAHLRRRRWGRATPEDAAIVWGATALVALFLVTLPLVAAGVTVPVQLQISRIFWLVDAVATIYVIAVVADAPAASGASVLRTLVPRLVLSALLVASAARGIYALGVERPDRSLFAVTVADSPWEDAMRWIAAQPLDVNVLADPGHAWKYGTSVRASGGRDVLLEEVKDSAIAIYSRDVAARVVDRTAAIGDFAAMTPAHARDLARRYDVDYLVTDADLALPLSYRNEQFRIYSLQ